MPTPARKAQNLKGIARAGVRRARSDPKAAKLAQAQAAYKEALKQQAATAEILRVISSSPTDLQPVFDTILSHAITLCAGDVAVLWRYDGKLLRFAAHRNCSGRAVAYLKNHPLELGTYNATPQAGLERRIVHVVDAFARPNYRPLIPAGTLRARPKTPTVLAVPLLRGKELFGVMTVWRYAHQPFGEKQIALIQTFAAQAVIAIENVRLFNETKEALEHQTAISEVLEKISGSPTDVAPVLAAVAERAARLCEGEQATVLMVEDGNVLRPRFTYSSDKGPLPNPQTQVFLDRGYVTGRAALDGVAINVEDVAALTDSEYPAGRENQQKLGYRSFLAAPMMREGRAIGVIAVWRRFVRRFSDKHVTLVKTFADQAAIAIENVRLFNETKESLEQQTAISEILRVISDSPTDVKPVLDAVAVRAARICEASDARIHVVDGQKMRHAAGFGDVPTSLDIGATRPLDRGFVGGRAVLDGAPVHVEDILAASAQFPLAQASSRAGGIRTILAVPLMREGRALGAILLRRRETRPFSEKQIALLRTFADQAAIAIENVRLFNELEARNKALSEALEQQTATAEILKVISSSPTDVRPVFETIVRSGAQLCAGQLCTLVGLEGETLTLLATYNYRAEGEALLRTLFPRPLSRDTNSGRAILEKRTLQIADVLQDSGYAIKNPATARAVVSVPLIREGKPVGALTVGRNSPGSFSEHQVALLRTFADQAVIAIENVRLFKELEARNRDLSESLNQQTATAEVLKLISRTTFELEKVLQTLLDNAARLSGAVRAAMLRPDADGNYVPAVTFNYEPDGPLMRRMRKRPIRPGRDSINGRALIEKRPIHVPDVLADAEYGRKDLTDIERYRTVLSVPMLRNGEAIGLIALIKGETVDPFTEKQMDVVTTFADQAVIAIENVRLFREIEHKSAQLEVANKHKSEFLANMSHELRTPLNAIIGFSEVLIDKMFGELNEKQADYLNDIHESGKHLLSLINDILDLSKIEAGRMELEISSFHLPSAISNAMTLVRERAQRHSIALGQEVDPRLGEFQADERKFKQILLNLLSNAVKFTPDGGRVDVCAKRDTTNVEIAVRDTGVGIAPDDQGALFEEFKQVGRDYTRKAEGTGLGLALTKRFVELHGGEIRVDSAPGKGSTFTVLLPLRE